MNTVSGTNSGYRDWFNDQSRDETTPNSKKTGGVDYGDTVFTDKKTNSVSVDDFLNLMVAQLTNQDFMNPVDDTQYVAQLAQFATMQQMQDLAAYSKSNYVMSLIGKTVTTASFTIGGGVQKTTGVISKVSLVDNEYLVYIGDKSFTLEQIMEIGGSSSTGGSGSTDTDYSKATYLQSLLGKNVTVAPVDKDGKKLDEVTGDVTRTAIEKGKYMLYIGEDSYELDQLVSVNDKKAEDVEPEAETFMLPPQNLGNSTANSGMIAGGILTDEDNNPTTEETPTVPKDPAIIEV